MSIIYTLAQLAHYLNGTAHGQMERPIQGVASLSRANSLQLAYFDNAALIDSLQNTNAGAVLLSPSFVSASPVDCISVTNPLQCINTVFHLFVQSNSTESGIHPSAVVPPSVALGCLVSIGENTIIGEDVVIGDGVTIGPSCWIAKGVSIGSHTVLASHISVHEGTRIGNGGCVESGVVLGARPFNACKQRGVWSAGPAVGGLIIGDQTKVGANTVISNGSVSDTIIGDGVQIDNLVHVAHDVIIGAHSALAGCAVIGAFACIGAHCIIGGGSCVAAYVQLGDDVVITGMSTVNKSLCKSGIYSSGTMVSEHARWRRNAARFRRLDDYVTRLLRLEKVK